MGDRKGVEVGQEGSPARERAGSESLEWWGVTIPASLRDLASCPKEELLKTLGCEDVENGLSTNQVVEKLKMWGPNKIPKLKESGLGGLAGAFARILPPSTKVVRQGNVIRILSSDLVPGDVVLLEMGDQCPADIRLLELSESFRVDQSAMNSADIDARTKSIEVSGNGKGEFGAGPDNLVLLGMLIVEGKARGVVLTTGRDTFMGLKCGTEGLYAADSQCCDSKCCGACVVS